MTLRIIAPRQFRLRWSSDGWTTSREDPGVETAVGIWYHDIDSGNADGNDVRFTFHWEDTDQWEPADYRVAIQR